MRPQHSNGRSPRLHSGTSTPRCVLLRRLLHALLEQRLELRADLFGLALELAQEVALLIIDLALGEEEMPQPGRLPGANPAVRQDVVLDGLIEELLKAPRAILRPFVQFGQE